MRRAQPAQRPPSAEEMEAAEIAELESHMHNLESEYGSDDSAGGGARPSPLRTDDRDRPTPASPGFESSYEESGGGLLSDPLSSAGAQTPLAFAQSPAAHGMFGGGAGSTSSSRTRTPELDLGAPAKRPSLTGGSSMTGGRSAPMETIIDDPNSPAARQILKSSAGTAGASSRFQQPAARERKPARIENQPSLHAYIEVQAKALERLLGCDGGSGASMMLLGSDPKLLAQHPAVQQLLAEQAKALAAAAQDAAKQQLAASQAQVQSLESALAKSEHNTRELQSLVSDWEKTVKQLQEDQAALVAEGVKAALEERRIAAMAGSALRTPTPSRWRNDLARAQEIASSGRKGTPGSAMRGLGSPRAALEPTPSPEPELPLLPTSSAVAERERLLSQLNDENAELHAQVDALQTELQQMCERYEAACKELEGQDKTVPDAAATPSATAATATATDVTPPRKRRGGGGGASAAAEGISDSDSDEGEAGGAGGKHKPDPAVAAQAHRRLLSQSHDLFILQNQLVDLREQLAQQQRASDAAAKTVADEHHARMDEVQAQNSYFVRELEGAHVAHSAEIERLRTEHTREMAAAQAKMQQNAAAVAQADTKVAEAFAQAQRDAQAHENSLAELRLKLRKAESAARDASEQLAHAESRAAELQQALEDLAARHAALESSQSVGAEDASSLKELLDRVRAALQQQTFNKNVMARAMEEYERSIMLEQQTSQQGQQQSTELASPASQVRHHSHAAAAATRALSNALLDGGAAHAPQQHDHDHDPDNPFLEEEDDGASHSSGNPFLEGADHDEELRAYLEQLRQVQRQNQLAQADRLALQQRVAALEEELAQAMQQAADSAAAAAAAQSRASPAQPPPQQRAQPPPSHMRVLSSTGSEADAARVRSPFDSDEEDDDDESLKGIVHRQAPSISSDQAGRGTGAGAAATTSPSHAAQPSDTPFDLLLNDAPVSTGAAAATGFDSPHVGQKLVAASAENRRLAGQVAALQRQLNDMQRAQQQESLRAQQAEADAARQLDALMSARRELQQTKDALAAAQAAYEKAAYDAAQLAPLQHSFEAQQALMQSLHVEAAQLQSELAALHSQHAALKEQLATQTDELANTRQAAMMQSLEREQRDQEERERRDQIAREMEQLVEALQKQKQRPQPQQDEDASSSGADPHSAPVRPLSSNLADQQQQPLLAPHAQRIRDLWRTELDRLAAEIDALQRELAQAQEREATAAAEAEAAAAAAEKKLAPESDDASARSAPAAESADASRALQEAQMDKLVLQSQLLGLSELHQQKEAAWAAERKALEAGVNDLRKAEALVESLEQDVHAAQLKAALQAERVALLERDLAAATHATAPPSPLQARTAQLESQERMQALSDELDKLEQRNAELRTLRAEADEANRELREQNELQSHTIAQLEKELQEREARCATLTEQLRKFETDLSAAGRRSQGDSRSFDDERSSLLQQIAYLESGLRVQMDIVTELRRKQREQKAAEKETGPGVGTDETQPLDDTVPASASAASASRPRTPGRAASSRRGGPVTGGGDDDIITVTTVTSSTTSSLHITGGGPLGPLSPRHTKSKSTPHSPMAAADAAAAAGSSSPKSSLLRSGSGTGGGATPARDRDASSLLYVTAAKDSEIAALRQRVSSLEAELTHWRVKHESAAKAHAAHMDQCGPQIRSLLQQVDNCRAQHDLAFVTANAAALESHPAYTAKLAQREREFSAAIRAELEHHERVRTELDQRHQSESERWRAERVQMEHRHAQKEEEFRRAKAELQAAVAAAARPAIVHSNGPASSGGLGSGTVRNELHYSSTTNVNARSGAAGSTAERSTHTTFTATVTTDGPPAAAARGNGAGTGPSTPLLPHQLKSHSLLALRSPATDAAGASSASAPPSTDDDEFAAAAGASSSAATTDAAIAAAIASASASASASFLPLIRALQGDKSLLEQTILQHVKSLNSVDRRARSVEQRNQELEVTLRQAVAGLPSEQRSAMEREIESAPASSLRSARDLRSHDPYSPVITPKRTPLLSSMLSPAPASAAAAPASGPRRTLPLHATPPSVLRGGAGLDSAATTPLAPPSLQSPLGSAPPSAAAASSTRSRVDVSHTAAQLSYLQQTLLNLQKKQMQRQAQQQAQTPRSAAATPQAASASAAAMHASPASSTPSALNATAPAPRSFVTPHRPSEVHEAASAHPPASASLFGDEPADWAMAPLPSFQLSADAFAVPLATQTEVRSRRVETTTITSSVGLEPPSAGAARSRAGSHPRTSPAAEHSQA